MRIRVARRLLPWLSFGFFAAGPVAAEPACPRVEGELPAAYSFEQSGKLRHASAELLVPVRAADAAALLRELESWPRWLFLAPDGQPNLRGLSFDPASGRAEARFGEGADDVLVAWVTQEVKGEGSRTRLRFEGLEHVRDLEADVEVSPRDCGDGGAWSLVAARLTWGFALTARLLASDQDKILPAVLVLALRDDLAAEVVGRDRAALARFAGARLDGEPGAPPVVAAVTAVHGGEVSEAEPASRLQPGDELLRVVPRVLRLSPEARAALERAVSGGNKSGLLERLLGALGHEHAYVAGAPLVRRGERRIALPARPTEPGEGVVGVRFTGRRLELAVSLAAP